MRLLILLAACLLAGCDITLTTPSPVVTAGTTPGNITISNTNTNTATTDRSDTDPVATPMPSGTTPSSTGALPLPVYGEGVARDYAAQHPALVTHSCQLTDGDGAWQFLDGLIAALQARDARWGYLCKDANCTALGRDVVTYKASSGGPSDSPTQFRWGVLPFETVRRWIGHR
jgi:hypothetical protein